MFLRDGTEHYEQFCNRIPFEKTTLDFPILFAISLVFLPDSVAI